MLKRGAAFLPIVIATIIIIAVAGHFLTLPWLSPSDDAGDFAEGEGDEPSPSGPIIQPRTICSEKTWATYGRYNFGYGSSNPINLGESLDEIVEEINESNMLWAGLGRNLYTTNANAAFEYMQKIFISDNPLPEQRLLLKHFKDNLYNPDRPEIGIPINTQTKILNYELSFIAPASSTLRQVGNEQIIENFVSTDIKIMEQLYQVQNAVIRDNKIRFTLYQPVTAEIIELIENEPSQINGQSANGLVADFEWNYQGANQVEISKIMLKWTAQNKMFIAYERGGQNTLVAMPGFEHLNFNSWGFFTPFSDRVYSSVQSYSDTFYIGSRVRWNDLQIPLLYGDRVNEVLLGAGESEANKLATPDSSIQTNVLFYSPEHPTNHSYFIASYKGGVYARGSESYILRFTNFREEFGVNYVDVQMLIEPGLINPSSWEDVCLNKKTNDTCFVGRVTLHLESVLSNPRSVLLTGGAFVTFDKFYTEEGLQIQLPIIRPAGAACQFKGCLRVGQDTNFTLWFTEEDGDEVLASGEEFYSLIGYTRGSADPFRILEYSPELTFLSGIRRFRIGSFPYEEAYVVSPLATRIETQQSDLFDLVEYHGAESFGSISLRITPEICSACNSELYYEVSLEEITATQVRLRISSELTMPSGHTTPLLIRGEIYVLPDSSKIRIDYINFFNRAVGISIIAPPEYGGYTSGSWVEEGESEIVSFCFYCIWMGYYANQTRLVSWWPFNNNAEDIIDNNDGILQSGMEFVNGIVNDALRFDGIDDYVLVQDADNLDLTDFATIDAWAKPLSSMTNSEGIVFKRNNEGSGAVYGLFMAENGGVRFQVTIDNFGILSTEATEPLPLDRWSHVAGEFSTKDDITQIDVYLNGQRQQTNAIPSFNVLEQNNKDVYIGAPLYASSNNYFHGLIDEVEISNQSLPITQIYRAFENGKCRPINPPAPICGNGIVEQGEECDDGNRDPADQCSNECTLTFCGDSIVQLPNGGGRGQPIKYEECDTYIGQVTCSSLLGPGWSGFAECNHPPSEYMCEWNTRGCRYILPPPPPTARCGNGVCELGETCATCVPDCGICGGISQACGPGTICIE